MTSLTAFVIKHYEVIKAVCLAIIVFTLVLGLGWEVAKQVGETVNFSNVTIALN